jgi:hypothetical protein
LADEELVACGICSARVAAWAEPNHRAAADIGRSGIAHADSEARAQLGYETLEPEVRTNVVYRSFCRVGTEKLPDAKTLIRLGQVIGPETIAELHDRVVALAQKRQVVRGRKMRVVDTTVVESNIHYPTTADC